MQVAVITGPTCNQIQSRLLFAKRKKFGVELRLDLFQKICIESLNKIRSLMPYPTIFTLRSHLSQGGWNKSTKQQISCIQDLLSLKPDYMDLEHTTDEDFLEKIYKDHPQTKVLLSYHNFQDTPKNLDEIFLDLQRKYVDVYKICTQANTITDSYRMLQFIQKHSSSAKIVGICMGSLGQVTRTDGIQAGNFLNYRILSKKDCCAPGMIF